MEFEDFEERDGITQMYGNPVTQGSPVRKVILDTNIDSQVNFPIIFDENNNKYFIIVEYNNADLKDIQYLEYIQYLKDKGIPNYCILKSVKYDSAMPISLYGDTKEECIDKLDMFNDRLSNLSHPSVKSNHIILYIIKPSIEAIAAFKKVLRGQHNESNKSYKYNPNIIGVSNTINDSQRNSMFTPKDGGTKKRKKLKKKLKKKHKASRKKKKRMAYIPFKYIGLIKN